MKNQSFAVNIKLRFVTACLTTLLALTVCDLYGQNCDFRTGIISLQAGGGNISPLYTNSYVLTNPDGLILSVTSEPTVEIFTEWFYILYAINYKIGSAIEGMDVGEYVQNITGI